MSSVEYDGIPGDNVALLHTAIPPWPRRIDFDKGRHHRAKIGFVLLAMEQTIEEDMFRLCPPGVGVHFTRAPMANRISVATLSAMAAGIGDAAGLLLPDEDLDVACYACTSGSVVIGEERVFSELKRGKPKARPTCLISSVMKALNTLGTRRIAVATPYLAEVNVIEQRYMAARGFEIVNIQGLDIENDADMVRVSPQTILDFAQFVDRPEADAMFISCGALRSIDIITDLEVRLGKPVVTSNQAMMWDCLRLADITDRRTDCGRLFQDY
ncbi:arylmalonate decarboxylase [Labrys okinawensis]|uniref:maleate cis-trans isomerase family protein n=1 Tax=Labrys okinawensis TaxID=346911 RepID=UPI0039BD7DE3